MIQALPMLRLPEERKRIINAAIQKVTMDSATDSNIRAMAPIRLLKIQKALRPKMSEAWEAPYIKGMAAKPPMIAVLEISVAE